MDIPNTGAIFTLGKSYLAENTQSYFYIKNDPVKRLISGPHQSAVICESGRLFVWGENHYGQLGIGSPSNQNGNNNKNHNSTSHGDIITKPTCVKSLKTLGLKIADVAFGNDWSIILTHSNELFYTGRNIFPSESNVARNFSVATVADEQCQIIRKPFRIEDLDECLSKNEDAECYTHVLAGDEHFVLMTSFGRLIGWGSNQNYQLGMPAGHTVQKPHEINLGAAVQQFVCGPESTLVLTTTGKLYFTGHLNDFVFSQFTELQQNLGPTEQIIFMHISKTNDIFIVTNAGSIYRSIESVRTKSLIFQRFYDYDSEENGPIWKLLKGFSFYAVLTKANKFYTTFSESGHHLKTFREISKFKNLRLLDVAVGNKHILVHGIPRSSTVSTSVGGSIEPHRFASRTFVMPPTLVNGTGAKSWSRVNSATKAESKDGGKVEAEDKKLEDANSNVMANGANNEPTEVAEKNTEIKTVADQHNGNVNETKAEVTRSTSATSTTKTDEQKTQEKEPENVEKNIEANGVAENNGNVTKQTETNGNLEMSDNEPVKEAKLVMAATAALVHNEAKSPTNSIKSIRSIKSAHSVKFSPTALSKKASPATDKLLRPHTPYPDSSTTGSTPTTIKKTTPLRNFSYEAAMDHDHIDSTSPVLMDSLENISESTEGEREHKNALASSAALPFEEDEQLTVEINTTTDPLNSTIVVNEIRFINNGVDVTDNVKAASLEREDTESTLDSLEEQAEGITSKSNETLNNLSQGHNSDMEEVGGGGEEIKNTMQKIEDNAKEVTHKIGTKVDEADTAVKNIVESKLEKVNDAASEIKDDLAQQAAQIDEDIKTTKTELKTNAEKVGETITDKMENAAKKAATAATDVRDTVETAAKRAAAGARDAVETMGDNAKRVANDTKTTVESIGSSAKRAATGAKNAVGNVFIKMSDGTKDAVDSVAAKIASEVSGAKENINTMFQSKTLKPTPVEEDAVSSASEAASKGGLKTNTTTNGEDDERTTASVNSTQNSTGNPFESNNPFENDEFDDVVERGKKAMQVEINTVHRQVAEEIKDAEKETSKVRKFFSEMRGISCRNEKSVAVDDDPPRYSVEDKYPTPAHRDREQNNTSKVCSIL
ncbi:X-linked retinitis pigmentosa GTPase regulator isoform X1 [Bactrocera tryoni]|uniref:X-linked retinitis pigmentosa GTPase regulator isoform X1 n=1 Tax=Bactrocera tryoni TaxID=59916 RepID=UPI001A99D49C|nr:X-linked retinitis pigmentosa GTPase regulator isoform X1 [Bactrocera tryoni]